MLGHEYRVFPKGALTENSTFLLNIYGSLENSMWKHAISWINQIPIIEHRLCGSLNGTTLWATYDSQQITAARMIHLSNCYPLSHTQKNIYILLLWLWTAFVELLYMNLLWFYYIISDLVAIHAIIWMYQFSHPHISFPPPHLSLSLLYLSILLLLLSQSRSRCFFWFLQIVQRKVWYFTYSSLFDIAMCAMCLSHCQVLVSQSC